MSVAGRIITTSRGYKCFLPNPLPPTINWDLNLINALSDADRVLGQLAGEGQRLPNPYLLIRPFIAREAVLSSRIEGTQATLGEVLAAKAGAAVAGPFRIDKKQLEDMISRAIAQAPASSATSIH